MKAKLISVIIFILVLASACATQTSVTQPVEKTPSQAQSTASAPSAPVQKNIPQDINNLFAKAATRVKSASYLYQGPETGTGFYQFYVKGDKIKYIPSRSMKSLDRPEAFDSVFIDTTAKTARQYCIDPTCKYKGIKAELDYKSAYIPTVLDWTDTVSAQKIAEEQIESRATWVIKTDKATIWVDTYYGVPLEAQVGNNVYKYQKLNANSVQDSDVVPG